MSTNSIVVGIAFCGLAIDAILSRRGSGTGTMPQFGSIVQNGKFSAAMPALVSALNSVDLPTFGKPTIPQLKPISPLFVRLRVYVKLRVYFECMQLIHRARPLSSQPKWNCFKRS